MDHASLAEYQAINIRDRQDERTGVRINREPPSPGTLGRVVKCGALLTGTLPFKAFGSALCGAGTGMGSANLIRIGLYTTTTSFFSSIYASDSSYLCRPYPHLSYWVADHPGHTCGEVLFSLMSYSVGLFFGHYFFKQPE